MYVDPPKKLVDLILFASLMRNGAKALGGADGIELFDDEVICGLLRNRWPIEDKYDPAFGAMHEFVLEKLFSFGEHDPRYNVYTAIATWLQESAQEETRKFLSNDKNLAKLEEVLNKTLEILTAAYGNPLNAAPLRKSVLKQSFDAIKNNSVEAKTERLNEALAFVSAGLQKYNKNDLPAKEFLQRDLLVNEFWQRTEDNLAKKDWPFSRDPDKTLMHALKLLTRSGSYAKLMNALEQLTKSGDPPMTTDRSEALEWSANFILGYSQELKETAEAVFHELENEAKTPNGISLMRSALSKKIFPN
jgi:hypothetical protein